MNNLGASIFMELLCYFLHLPPISKGNSFLLGMKRALSAYEIRRAYTRAKIRHLNVDSSEKSF